MKSESTVIISLTIVRYPVIFVPIAFLSMAIFRLPLYFQKGLQFSKLLGCGKNGTFDIYPDWQQWGLLGVWETRENYEQFRRHSFIAFWWKILTVEQWTLLCSPYESHGKWDGQEPFGSLNFDKDYKGTIAVLTRATIRWSKLRSFWQNVPAVATTMTKAKGFIMSVGIGEAPFFRQATFSIWENLEDVKKFAYRQREHSEVIQKTRQQNWYSEELFARFIPLENWGTIRGKNPMRREP